MCSIDYAQKLNDKRMIKSPYFVQCKATGFLIFGQIMPNLRVLIDILMGYSEKID